MSRNFRLSGFIFAVFFASVFPVFSQVEFGSMDLNNNDFLIFSVRQDIPGTPLYSSLFFTQLDEQDIKKEPVILTCFPEKMEVLNGCKILQVRNRYGTAEYSFEEKTLKWTSLASGIPEDYSRANILSASPDGNYFCYVKKEKNTAGSLIVADFKTKEEKVLVENVAFSCKSVPVKWSPDSRFLLYENNGSVYFIRPEEIFSKINLPESYRKIGRGSIDSVQWTQDMHIMYISDDIVFLIEENELYTRGLYSQLIGSGRIVGRLPGIFDFFKDKFWTNVDGSRFAVVSGKNTLSVYSTVKNEDLRCLKPDGVFPLSDVAESLCGITMFWDSNSVPMLWCDTVSLESPKRVSYAYSVKDSLELLFQAEESIVPEISPDRRKIAYTDSGNFFVYDISMQKLLLTKSVEKTVSAAWSGNFAVCVGGEETVRLVSLNGDEKPLFLSSACQPFWSNGRIISRTENSKEAFVYDSDRNSWRLIFVPASETSVHLEKNGRFRVFLGSSVNPKFKNSIYVRSLSGKTKTYSVYKETEVYSAPLKKAALVFDAMENSEGLAEILYALDDFNVKGTFFLNGEFIRRYPRKTRQIALSGNESASLFFTSADLTENSFLVDKNFVLRGLARNEDEFFTATGKELSLYWHAPFYHSTSLMKNAGAEAGYNYVEAFTKFSDRISFEQAEKSGAKYSSASELVNLLSENLYDGIVIPVSIGTIGGTRRDYLYEKLDLLISAILEDGYEIVLVKDLH
ncbi:polysaccharide deacetylase family protein [Treponema sp.]|uniref:polysaccharide deacetylase family protein n=1 Tax=Treponema sp. TaxID=166 RepID=UPI003F0C0AF7